MPARKKTARKARRKSPARNKPATAQKATRPKGAAGAAKSTPEVSVATATPRSLEERVLGPLEELERMLDTLRRGDWFGPMRRDWPRWPELLPESRFPSIDVVDRDKELQIKAEVPGFDREGLSVTVSDRALTIKGESRHEEESDQGELRRREIRRGSFTRTVALPEDVDGSKARASYKDGVLELRLPKRRRSKRHDVQVD